MSCINLETLTIRGIRSYGNKPDDEQQIEFGKPLTLIQGGNGCGKTTIIECLQFIFTGSPSGILDKESFIYNPKEECIKKVAAEVRLTFTSKNSKEVLAVRKPTATWNEEEAKRSYSLVASDNIVEIDQVRLPLKKDNMNAEMECLVSIPSNVLKKVILCHQEDSFWPFGTAGEVKDVFDKLFDLEGYVKALRDIKHEQKQKEEDLKILQEKKISFKMLKDKRDGAAMDFENYKMKISEAKIAITEKTAELKPLKAMYKEVNGQNEERKNLKLEQDFCLSACKKKNIDMKNYATASLDSITQQLTDKEAKDTDYQKQLSRNKDYEDEVEKNLQAARSKEQKSQSKKKEVERATMKFKEDCEKRDTRMRSIVQNLGISEALKLPSKITKESFTEFQEKVQNELTSLARQQDSEDDSHYFPKKGKAARKPKSTRENQPKEPEGDDQELLNLQNFILKLIRKHGEAIWKSHQYDACKASLQDDGLQCPLCHEQLDMQKTGKLLLEIKNEMCSEEEKEHVTQEVRDGLSRHQLICCSKRIKTIQDSFNEVLALNLDIESYEAANAEGKVQKLNKDIKDAQKEVKEIEVKKGKMDERKANLNREIDSLKKVTEKLEVIIEYKEKEKEVNLFKQKMQEIYGKTVQKEFDTIKEKIKELEEETNLKKGELKPLSNSREKAEKILQSDECKNAEQQGRLHRGKIEVYKNACEDLEEYGKALNQAIIKYPEVMMEKINSYIMDKWKKVYRGKDIDFIEINAELDETKKTLHNYRVVMVKDSKKMDMRGRCSAGQKVLASVIIRLALAEALGSNCKLLALDEPTTNLDSNHIEALANALVDIVKDHEGQQNFQLIVITHNEHFVECLRQAKLTDYCYKITKNNEGKSVANKEKM